MNTALIVVAVVVLLALGALVKAVTIVSLGYATIVERSGRYSRTLHAGRHLLIPFMDSISVSFDLREQAFGIPPAPVTTRDNRTVKIDSVVYCQVVDPRAAGYEVRNWVGAVEQLVLITLCEKAGGMDLERILLSRAELNAALREALDGATGRWGIRVNKVAVKTIEPPAAVLGHGSRHGTAGPPGSDRRPDPSPVHQPLRQDDPRTVGPYTLTARLGQGGTGTVYLGRSPGGRAVAVKVIQAELADDPTFRGRFAREIEAARRIGGFHTAAVVDADADAGHPWLATEYIPGPALHDVLGQHGALPARTLHILALGMAEALEGIHAGGIIHRDLKPSNVIVARTGPRVIDFGIARFADSTALAGAGMVSGSREFLAPEQLTGTGTTPAADLYAFAMVLCHAAGAVPVADGETLTAALTLLPASVGDVVTRCLDHDPAGRPTASEALDRLTRNHTWSEDWLPPAVTTMVDLRETPTASAP